MDVYPRRMLRAVMGFAVLLVACGPLPCKHPEPRARLVSSTPSPSPGVYHDFSYIWDDHVFVGEGGRVMIAIDGDLRLVDAGTTKTLYGVYWDGPFMIAVGADGVIRLGDADGSEWTAVNSGVEADLYAVEIRQEGDLVVSVIVGDGVALRSTDRKVWTPAALPTGDERLRDVRATQQGWLAIGEVGVMLTAGPLAEVWDEAVSPTTADLRYFSQDQAIVGEDVLLIGEPGAWEVAELPLSGVIADATGQTLVMRDGRLGHVDYPGAWDYVPLPADVPLPGIRRIYSDSADTLSLLADDGSLLTVEYAQVEGSTSEFCEPVD